MYKIGEDVFVFTQDVANINMNGVMGRIVNFYNGTFYNLNSLGNLGFEASDIVAKQTGIAMGYIPPKFNIGDKVITNYNSDRTIIKDYKYNIITKMYMYNVETGIPYPDRALTLIESSPAVSMNCSVEMIHECSDIPKLYDTITIKKVGGVWLLRIKENSWSEGSTINIQKCPYCGIDLIKFESLVGGYNVYNSYRGY